MIEFLKRLLGFQKIKIKKPTKRCIKKCQYCKSFFKGPVDCFFCKYCKKYHCSKHRLPEYHDCKGNPKAPPGAFREVHTPKGITVLGK